MYWELLKGIDRSSSISRIKGFLYSVCDLFYEKLDPTQEEKLMGRDRMLREVLYYVEQNIHTQCALTIVAEELGYSASYLSRAFSTMVGIPYTAYVRNAKVNRAYYLLTRELGHDIIYIC